MLFQGRISISAFHLWCSCIIYWRKVGCPFSIEGRLTYAFIAFALLKQCTHVIIRAFISLLKFVVRLVKNIYFVSHCLSDYRLLVTWTVNVLPDYWLYKEIIKTCAYLQFGCFFLGFNSNLMNHIVKIALGFFGIFPEVSHSLVMYCFKNSTSTPCV